MKLHYFAYNAKTKTAYISYRDRIIGGYLEIPYHDAIKSAYAPCFVLNAVLAHFQVWPYHLN